MLAPGGSLELLAVCDVDAAAAAGVLSSVAAEQLEQDAESALEAARALAPEASARLVAGKTAPALLGGIGRLGATLVAVSDRHRSRGAGILLGGVTTTLLHEAPCSVLVARPSSGGSFPRRILVGFDGSADSAEALAAARELADRRGSELRALVALGGKGVGIDAVRRALPGVEEQRAAPVSALVDASRDAHLLVVGSRGLHGLAALGSVSERVAHRAHCSVLVVRLRAEP